MSLDRCSFAACLALLTAALAAPAAPARAAEDDEMSFELVEIDPEEEARRASARKRLMRPTSFVDLGFLWNSRDDFKLGDFTGLEDAGFEALGAFDLDFRAAWDAERPWYARATGQNLGLRSRFVSGEVGVAGLVGLAIQYDEIPHFESDSFFTPYRGAGGGTLTLPAGWVAGNTPADLAALGANLRSRDIQHERENLRASLDLVLPFGLDLDLRWRREVKDGVKITAGVLGSNGGNPRAALLPEPVDHTTDQGDVILRWGNERGQVQLGYHLSLFNQHDESLTWQSAFTAVGGFNAWDPSAGFAAGGQGRKGTAPDNQFHQVRLSGGVKLPRNTRFSLDAARGWMLQDETFLPYTVNPTLAASITSPLPNSDFDGRIESTVVNARLDSRPIPRVRLQASLRWDDRNDESSRDVYLYIPGDVAPQGNLAGATARANRTYSYERLEARTDARFDLGWRTELFGGYEYEQIERTYSDADETHEHATRLGLRSRPIRRANFRFEWQRSERFGEDYDASASFLAGLSQERVATLSGIGLFENHPLLRRSFLTDRERNRFTAALQLTPHETFQLGFTVDRIDDEYPDTTLGLLRSQSSTWSADLAFFPCEALSLHAFYSFEDYRTKQRGHAFNGNAVAVQQADLRRRWLARDTDAVDTAGFGFDGSFWDGRIEIDGDYVYTRARGTIDTSTITPPLASSNPNFPDATSRLHGATVGARYRWNDWLSFRLGYQFEKLDVDDWALENVTPTTLADILTDGRRETEYSAHLVGFSVRYEYR